MAESITGIILSGQEVHYALKAFEVLLRDRRPSPQLAEFLARLQRAYVESDVHRRNACGDVRLSDPDGTPRGFLAGDVLDVAEAAKVLGIGAAGVRDLARRGRLPAVRAGRRWLLHAGSVVARAERQAAQR